MKKERGGIITGRGGVKWRGERERKRREKLGGIRKKRGGGEGEKGKGGSKATRGGENQKEGRGEKGVILGGVGGIPGYPLRPR